MRYFEGHTNFVQSLAFSPDGLFLASASADESARVWRLATAEVEQRFQTAGEREHNLAKGGDWADAVAFSPDGALLCTGSHDGVVALWESATGERASRGPWNRQGRVTSIAFAPDGRHLAWSSYNGFAVCDLHDPAPQRSWTNPNPLLFALRFNHTGDVLATGGTGPEVFLHDPQTGKVLAEYAHADPQGCWGLSFSPDGRTLALALAGGVQLWSTQSGSLRSHMHDHEDVVSGIVFSPDGSRLLSCSWDNTVRVYEVDPVSARVKRLVGVYDWHIGRLFDVAISPDGTLAAAGGNDGVRLVVWDVE